MTAPSGQAAVNIREASYYQEYQENVVKHRWFLAGEPARKPNPTAQKVQINILQYLIHLRMCKDVPTKMIKMFLLVENLRQQNPDNREEVVDLLRFRRIIGILTPGKYGIHVLSLSLRRRRRRVGPIAISQNHYNHDGIGKNTSLENFDFYYLQIGCNLLHDVHTSVCRRLVETFGIAKVDKVGIGYNRLGGVISWCLVAAEVVRKESTSAQQYVLLPLWYTSLQDPQNSDDATFDVKEDEKDVHVSPSGSDKPKKHDDKTKRDDKGKSLVDLSIGVRDLRAEFEEFPINSTSRVNAASVPVTVAGPNPTNSTNSFNTASPFDTAVSLNFGISGKSSFIDPSNYPDDPDMLVLEDIVYSDDVGAEADFFNLETNITTRSMARMVNEQGGLNQVNDDYFHTSRIEAIQLFLAYASFMGFMIYQIAVKSAFLYRTIEKEVYVCQTLGFEDPDYPDKVYKVVKVLYGLHQAPRA
nr:putative ribonuclease H-like domain-containing protein [Tanacetum cinerariifolium]